jgi:hypothetical protein
LQCGLLFQPATKLVFSVSVASRGSLQHHAGVFTKGSEQKKLVDGIMQTPESETGGASHMLLADSKITTT